MDDVTYYENATKKKNKAPDKKAPHYEGEITNRNNFVCSNLFTHQA